MAEWAKYCDAIVTIRRKSVPVEASIISALAPHISKGVARDLERAGTIGRTYFAGPPIRVHGALQLFAIDRARGFSGRPYIYHAGTARRRESLARSPRKDDLLKRLNDPQFDYLELAEDYAATTWGDHLIWDESVSAIHGHLLVPGPDFITRRSFLAWSMAPYPTYFDFDWEPTCEILDDSLSDLQTWPPIMQEMTCGGDDYEYQAFFCELCGGPVAEKQCQFCDAQFNAPLIQADWRVALPSLAAVVLQADGHKFTIDPVEARKAEHRIWAMPGYVPEIPAELRVLGKQQRSIRL